MPFLFPLTTVSYDINERFGTSDDKKQEVPEGLDGCGRLRGLGAHAIEKV